MFSIHGALFGFLVLLSYIESNQVYVSALNNGTAHVNGDEIINCTLCSDPDDTLLQPDAFFRFGDRLLTCQATHSRGNILMPRNECEVLQKWGNNFCMCGVKPVRNNCMLCEKRTNLPNGLLEGLPNVNCAMLEADARRDDPSLCPVWQKTIGTYCGCYNPIATENVCRLCGADEPLVNVTRLIYSVEKGEKTTISCGEVEFKANLPSSECKEYQSRYGPSCCIQKEDDQRIFSPVVAMSDAAASPLSMRYGIASLSNLLTYFLFLSSAIVGVAVLV